MNCVVDSFWNMLSMWSYLRDKLQGLNYTRKAKHKIMHRDMNTIFRGQSSYKTPIISAPGVVVDVKDDGQLVLAAGSPLRKLHMGASCSFNDSWLLKPAKKVAPAPEYLAGTYTGYRYPVLLCKFFACLVKTGRQNYASTFHESHYGTFTNIDYY